MRTKTVLLSALLGALGSVSVMAQTNVYSVNGVGYINLTLYPGFNMISCPLITGTNTIASLFPNQNGLYNNVSINQWNGSLYLGDFGDNSIFSSGTNGWDNNGVITLNPGMATWFQNPNATNMTVTFVGTIPTGTNMTNTIQANGFTMLSSIVPLTGDLCTNMNLTNFNNGDINGGQYEDSVFVWNASAHVYSTYQVLGSTFGGNGYQNQWGTTGDPVVTNVTQGFWYLDTGPAVQWTETFSISQ